MEVINCFFDKNFDFLEKVDSNINSQKNSDESESVNLSTEDKVKSIFSDYLTEIKTGDVKASEAYEMAQEGEKLVEHILDGNRDNPDHTIENLRKICWHLMSKCAEQGEFLHRGSIRFMDKNDVIFDWLKDFEGKGLYRRISTHFKDQSATLKRQNFLGHNNGLFLQPLQYGIEDYKLELPGGKGGILFDKLKDGSLFIKLENVGMPTGESALEILESTGFEKKKLIARVKHHRSVHAKNFFNGLKLFSPLRKIFERNLLVKKSRKDQKTAGEKQWVRLENIPSSIKEAFQGAVKSLTPSTNLQKLYVEKGLKGFQSEDRVILGGITAMEAVVKFLKKDNNTDNSSVIAFEKSVEQVLKGKQSHQLDRVGNEVIIKI